MSTSTIDSKPKPHKTSFAQLRSNLPLTILCALFLLLPLYRTGALEDSFITPKLLLLQMCTLLAIIGAIIQQSRQPSGKSVVRPLWTGWLFAGLVAVHALSLVYARSTALGLTALVYWTSGLMLYFTLTLCIRGTSAVTILFASGAAAAVLTGAWTIIEDATHGHALGEIVARLPDWRGHLAAGLGNSGHIAGFMGLFLPWMLYQFLSSTSLSHRLLLLCGLTIMAMAFVVTWSVGSSGATLLAIFIWAMIAWRIRALNYVRPINTLLLAIPVLVACAFYLLPHSLNPHAPSLWKEAFGSERWAEGWPTRIVIWKTTLHMIAQSFPFGIGAGNFTLEYVRQVVPDVISDPALRVYAGAFTNDAHNEYLQITCETGIGGILLFGAMIIAFFVSIRKGLHVACEAQCQWLLICAGAGVSVFLLDSLMTFPLRLVPHYAALCFFMAVPCMVSDSANGLGNRRGFPYKLLGIAAISLACMALQIRRVAAEYQLKQGRVVIESTATVINGQILSTWALADSLMRNALTQLAKGQNAPMQESLNRAKLAIQTGPAASAEMAFRKALEWDPRYSNASSRLGALLMMKGDYLEASAITQQTLRDLESSEIYERLGFSEYLQQHWDEARKYWSICKERRPIQAPMYNALLQQIPQK